MPVTTISPAFRLFHAGFRPLIFAFGLIVPLPAFAELSNDTLIGPGVRGRPAYAGSDSQRAELVPVVRYLGQPLFARSTQGVLEGGLRMELVPGLHAGAQLAYEQGRRTGDSGFLESRNVLGVSDGASIGAHVEWDQKIGPVPFTLLARARQHTESDRGAQADLRLSVGVFQSGRLGVGLFAQTTWGNAKSTNSFYGVTPQQSLATGLPAFAAGSGLLFSSAGLLYSIDLTKNWVVVGNFEARQLHGDARRSPLVERSTNHYETVGIAYRF